MGDSCQRGIEERGCRHVVVADDRYIAWDREAGQSKGPHHAKSHLIVSGDNRGKHLRAPLNELLRGDESPFCAPFPDNAGTFRDSVFLQCPGPTVPAKQTATPVQRPTDAGDSPMATLDQMFGATP